VLGLSTGPCSVVGCGAPVLPVVGLVFAGLSSGTLALLSGASRVLSAVVLVALTLVVAWLGWQAGQRGVDHPRSGRNNTTSFSLR
jgi:membrane protein implicated in regulation of membrane protease activity